jgi:hypothetical protein
MRLWLILSVHKVEQFAIPLTSRTIVFFNLLLDISKLISVEFLDKALLNMSNAERFNSPNLFFDIRRVVNE